jgi:hypothetical protein
MTAVTAAVDAWRSYGTAPETGFTTGADTRAKRFALLAALYAGIGYEGDAGREYKDVHDIYRNARQITNPVKALCDFYAVHLYSGPLSPDGEREVEGEDAALPLVTLIGGTPDSSDVGDAATAIDKAEKQLRSVFGQLSQGWWAWDTLLNHRVRQTEILGSMLTEIVDDPKSGKLALDMVWPGLVSEITLDYAGNVTGYVLEYQAFEPGPRDLQTGKREGGTTYNYRKVVTKESYAYYKNDKLDHEEPNPYTFVPAVWDRCRLGWSAWGEPAIFGSQGAMDEINELWSHADDRLHQMFSTPIVIAGSGGLNDITFAATSRTEVNTITVPGPGGMSTISFNMGDVTGSVDKIMDAISIECPELRVYDRIRDMSAVTGPGIRRAVADVEHRVNEQAALFDRQTIKLLQMGTAIGGMRANAGDWGEPGQLTSEQQKFLPFGLDSFKAGQLDCMMLPRTLVRESPSERIDTLIKISTLSDPWLLSQAGVPDDEIERMTAARDAARAELAQSFGIAAPTSAPNAQGNNQAVQTGEPSDTPTTNGQKGV